MYNLKISEKQAKVISKALDFYARIGSGHLKEIIWHPSVAKKMWVSEHDSFLDLSENYKIVGKWLEDIKYVIFDQKPDEFNGIHMAEEDDKIAYDLHQVIRNKLAWDEEPEGDIMVQFNEPLQVSEKEELAKIEKENK